MIGETVVTSYTSGLPSISRLPKKATGTTGGGWGGRKRRPCHPSSPSPHPSTLTPPSCFAAPLPMTMAVERGAHRRRGNQAAAWEMLNPSARHILTPLPYSSSLAGKFTVLPDAVDFADAIKANAEQALR